MNCSELCEELQATAESLAAASCADCAGWSDAQLVNETGNNTDVNQFYFYETETLTFLWILFIMIMLGNSAVVLALVTSKARKSRTNFFILHLAFADLSVGLISVLTDIGWKITVSWNAGNVACKIIKFFQILVTYSSTYVLVALSIDRCDAITHPMNFTGSWRRARLLIATAWCLSAVFSAPYLYLYREQLVGVPPRIECWIDVGSPRNWQLYMSLTATSLFILPAVIIAACYIIIVITIWRKGKELGSAAEKTSLPAGRRSTAADDQADRDTKRASSRGIIPKAKIKTVKMTFVIISVFIMCWSPYFIFNFLQVFKLLPETQTMVALSTFIQSLAPLNSAANPIIYCIFSGCDVCRALRRFPWVDTLLRRLFPCCRCAQAEPSGALTRIGTQYTFMSAESKRATISAGGAGSLVDSGRHGSLDVSRRLLPVGRRAAQRAEALRRDV
ncbi:cardioacceleratory peptide receptor-like [Amphibalanus amphitrite]|uniref:cardioacceleratory peptide receptor-like n=1 Tax=Amphibalanus amphitrite TaxID=1232801 RepID=UPI001C91E690|nr:cardioacceleratory peptide receptor-like [Amphibalanus amphitrite]XP_043233328.1 cardioacceleratory peptide receptor-like [Amphibalanus amphitrite]